MKKPLLLTILCTVIAAGFGLYAIVRRTDNPRGQSAGNAPPPIEVGIIAPLTGDIASLGVAFQRSAIIAQEEINREGGIAGRKLAFVSEDARCEPALAAAAAQKLVNIDRVKIIFGGMCSGEMLSAAPIAEEAGVIIISPSATSPDITQAGEYVFRTVPSDAGQGAAAAEYAFRILSARTASIISEQTDYSQGLRRVFSGRFQELGGSILADEAFQTGDTDLRAQVLKVKQAGSDIVFLLPQTPASAKLLAKQLMAQEARMRRLGSEANISRDALASDPSLFAGIIATEPYFDEHAPAAAEFLKKYEETYKEKPPFPSMMANMYSQTYLIKKGIETVGDDTKKLRDWLAATKGWRHALGELTFTPAGDRIGAYSIKEVQADGSLKELDVVKPE